MTDMITRVARAILKRRYYEPEFYSDVESFYLDCDPDLVMEAEADARAAIEAMRKPPVQYMQQYPPFGIVDDKGRWTGWYPGNEIRGYIWRDMIDAALASPPTPADVNGERT